MTLVGIHSLSKAHGSKTLFEEISFSISRGDRLGLIGPNGAGKSTLMKILAEKEDPDKGRLSKQKGLKVGYASQNPLLEKGSLLEVIGDSRRAQILLGKVGFTDFSLETTTLSGGWKKRFEIARANLCDPDLLLLDEPTNHLDLEGILWLEAFLKRQAPSYVVISHDRMFLENVCNKIIEINPCFPGGLFIVDGNMSTYNKRKQEFLDGQLKEEQGLKSALKNEREWLKRSPKARSTKSRSRVQLAHQMIDAHEEIKQRNVKKRAKIEFVGSERATRRLVVANNLTKTIGGKTLFEGLNFTLSPGSRIGIVGKNGTGKSTLLKMITGEVKQSQGTLKYADDLNIVYFDQHKESLDENATLKEALSSTDTVNYLGKELHVVTFAERFLFPRDKLQLPVRALSGGERARILIARLMLQPADILLLDEPTNDLDIPTLEVMEESLDEFPGALVLISHDRCLMDRVTKNILGLRPDGTHDFVAEYAQWKDLEETKKAKQKPVKEKKSLSYKEKMELDQMVEKIEALEKMIEELIQKGDFDAIAVEQKRLENLFSRWEELHERE